MTEPQSPFFRSQAGNFVGAFADAAILFPLLAALSATNGFSGTVLLGSAGLAYIVAGLVFRVPMSVQPLKSIAIAAIALGASSLEVRVSGALLGATCLLLVVAHTYRYSPKVPRHLIHGVQLGLGVILVLKGSEMALLNAHDVFHIMIPATLVGLMLLASQLRFPLLGIVATGGLLFALFGGDAAKLIPRAGNLVGATEGSLRLSIVLALVLPQIVLTSANSVVATEDAARRYFGEKAWRVTAKRLLLSIGIGNLLSSLVGGLPFCHGSGGLTAHVRGGATHWWANIVIGATLIALSFFQYLGGTFSLHYPPMLLAALLVVVGIFHMKLALPSWAVSTKRATLLTMAAAAWYSANMLIVLLAGLLMESTLLSSRVANRLILKGGVSTRDQL